MTKQQKIRNKIVDLKLKIDELDKELTDINNKELYPDLVNDYLNEYFTFTLVTEKNTIVVYIHIPNITDDCIIYSNCFTVCKNEYSDIVFDEKISRATLSHSVKITKEEYTTQLHNYLKQIALDYQL